jgi:aminoglycoside phosphotransferase (APT) family kinase protein
MMETVPPHLGTTTAQRFDKTALASWLTSNVDGFAGPLTIEQFKGGQSNPTFKLLTPSRNYVLRRKPFGPLLPGAHAIEREVRVLTALATVGFPVAQVLSLCSDSAVIGTEFYVMEMVEGRIFWDASLPEIASKDRSSYFDAMNSTIAQLHRIDYQAVGLDDYGKRGGYFERQIARWSQQYLKDTEAGRDPLMDRLIEWLPAHVPVDDEIAIVHGDFRIDNVIFHPKAPRIVAVIDWELSTLGHPFADFAYHAMMYHMPPSIVAGLSGADLTALNIPNEQSFVAAYCRRMGRATIENYNYYLAFSFFRMAAIFHGIQGRVIRGTASSAKAAESASAFPRLASIAWDMARRC